MSEAAQKNTGNFPAVRGRVTENAALGEVGWFRTGGRAEVLFKPADADDLAAFLAAYPSPSPLSRGPSLSLKGEGNEASPSGDSEVGEGHIHVFGVLSNTIIRDGGLKGVTIRMGREFAGIEVLPGHRIKVGAAALDGNVARVAAEAGIAGLEFLSGIPGSIGGALRMNAGCYGTETKDVLIEASALDRAGGLHHLSPRHPEGAMRPKDLEEILRCAQDDSGAEKMEMSYRHNDVSEDYIFTSCILQGAPGDPEAIAAHIAEIKEKREQSQPIREKTGGSTFANPSAEELSQAGLKEGTKVWQLIDQAGGRGLMVGGAQMSEKHCNFMINTGTASAADLENLGEEIRRRVYEESGIRLRWEIKRIGENA